MEKLNAIICLGKSINKNGSLDQILTNRVELAYKLANENQIPLILSGGKSHRRILEKITTSESFAMYRYLIQKYPKMKLRIILEEKGESTIHQLCILKNNSLLPNKWFSVGLVTDEVHLKRATITAEWIFGDKFKVHGFGSKVNLIGKLRKIYEEREKEKYNLTVESIIKKHKKGDDEVILQFDKKVRKISKKHIKERGNPLPAQNY